MGGRQSKVRPPHFSTKTSGFIPHQFLNRFINFLFPVQAFFGCARSKSRRDRHLVADGAQACQNLVDRPKAVRHRGLRHRGSAPDRWLRLWRQRAARMALCVDRATWRRRPRRALRDVLYTLQRSIVPTTNNLVMEPGQAEFSCRAARRHPRRARCLRTIGARPPMGQVPGFTPPSTAVSNASTCVA